MILNYYYYSVVACWLVTMSKRSGAMIFGYAQVPSE
jgi:hypothetical protein